jgi:RNA polymerase sigma-70 factor, ECF subfamily
MTDTHEFEAFMKAYQDMVYATAIRLLGTEAEAEDVAQEVFLKAFEHFDEIRQSPTVGGWLRTVARNLSLNHLSRYRARWRFFSEMRTDEDSADFENNLPAAEDRSSDPTRSDRYAYLEAALQKLPEKQRVPLVLFHFEEMRYEDIAARLGVSLSKVKTDIHRAREALYQRLQAHAEEFGVGLSAADHPANSQARTAWERVNETGIHDVPGTRPEMIGERPLVGAIKEWKAGANERS